VTPEELGQEVISIRGELAVAFALDERAFSLHAEARHLEQEAQDHRMAARKREGDLFKDFQ
jgi:hypothetical protein